jgi:outer membrane lipoprotein SlyB
MKIRWFGLMVLILALALPAPAVRAQTTGNPDEKQAEKEDKAEKERRKQEEKAAKKDEKDSKEAKELMEEMQADVDATALAFTSHLYPDKFLQDYVNEIGQRLVPRSAVPGLLFSFRVVDDPTPNAYALPDGRIFVNGGLLVFVRNEAQLAMVLAHEAGHVVEQHQIESIKEARSFKKRALPGILGAIGGAVVGGIIKGGEGAAVGAAVGLAGGVLYSTIALNQYNKRQEDEADTIGTRLMLAQGYDPTQGSALFQLLADRFPEKDRFAELLWAQHSRNVDRVAKIRALIDGDLSFTYNAERSAGKLSEGSGQLDFFLSRMYRDVAIRLMDVYDRYDVAKEVLERVVEYRARDPRALCAMGRVYKLVGRTAEDRAKALDYLQRAAQADERGLYPEVYRELGLMQARLATASGANMGPAIESMKRYITLWIERKGSEPDDLDEMYDYLLAFGDAQWTAPRLDALVARMGPPAEGARPAPGNLAKSDTARALLPTKKPKSQPVVPKN